MDVPIMVVEDNSITRKVMRVLLESEGFDVMEAPDGRSALEQASARMPALILQDLRLPDIKGSDLVGRLRSLPGGADLPIVAITGHVPDQVRADGAFTEIILKPVEPSRLLLTIRSLIQTNAAEEESVEPRRRALVADDDPIQRKLLRLHLAQRGYEVTEACNGTDALAQLVAAPPDLVVADLLMPELDGLGLCAAVRRDARLARLLVLLVSSHDLDEVDQQLAVRAGASRFISRSRGLAELDAALASFEDLGAPPGDPDVLSQAARMVSQLRREADLRQSFAETEAIVGTILPFFAQFASLSLDGDGEHLVDQLFTSFFDAAAVSVGCAFLVKGEHLELRCQVGFSARAVERLAEFYGHPELLDHALTANHPVKLPSPELDGDAAIDVLDGADVAALSIVPICFGDVKLGVLVLGHDRLAVASQKLRLACAACGPIAQALMLSRRISELVTSQRAFRGIVDASSNGIIVTDEHRAIKHVNPAAVATFGYGATELADTSIVSLLPFLGAEDACTGPAVHRNGSVVPVAVSITTVDDGAGQRLRAHLIQDLSLQATLERLSELANRDPLTHLYNRRRFEEHLAMRLDEAIRYKVGGALVLLDLDGFKAINDTHGHEAGDAVLVATADRLRQTLRGTDFVARFGGDEIAVELARIDRRDALDVAEKLIAVIRTPVAWRDESLAVGASAGIAMYPDDGDSARELCVAADEALYAAKRSGRGRAIDAASRKTFP